MVDLTLVLMEELKLLEEMAVQVVEVEAVLEDLDVVLQIQLQELRLLVQQIQVVVEEDEVGILTQVQLAALE